ncbi:leucine-rich transmembrane protein, putative [Pediculus humanus corporis]|uniref:Leucine-rich transmembrane protein, putative n=1 Tax=Pediculus humanus subsp. corporis TaxID=121224 RepID=E0VD27_PEDHC|nr:leucine-rich transmembrane protein, putative [Pediculus humanus corporis]EEB11283.1 leucine-rich transmembrane protein, putative [Pediculus humanus corporis]
MGKGKSGIFTYKITCEGIRDLKSLSFQYLPESTTQLIIRQTYFQSFNIFRQILSESPLQLKKLTLLSVTDGVINQTTIQNTFSNNFLLKKNDTIIKSIKKEKEKEKENEKNNGGFDNKKKKDEFLPFALLQNPKLRTKHDGEDSMMMTSTTTTMTYRKNVKFKNVKILILSNNSLEHIPENTFDQFQHLEILNLSNNLIKIIDNDTFNPLNNLLELDVHSNKLASLNEIIFKNLTKLIYLDVSENFISNVAPSTFQYLTNLNILNLARNPLSEKQESVMPLLGTGKRLQIVDMSKTGIKQIPGTLERSVRILNVMGNHLLSIRCGDLDSYFLLSYLNLKNNKISYIEDDALGRLEFLNHLQISDNNLFQIPKSLPNNLEILNLSYNNIQNVSGSDFLNLSRLKQLFLSYNQISYIEENSFNNLVNLNTLDLSHNPMLTLPNINGKMKLKILNLSYLTNIPERFTTRYKQFPIQSPENVKRLNLASSPALTSIFLQDTKTLQLFIKLQELDVRFSNLTIMRKDIFGLLPKLKIFKVEGNPWHCGREILILSKWLKIHVIENLNYDQEDDINTAHCSTPVSLYKTALIDLKETDFDDAQDKKDFYDDYYPFLMKKTTETLRQESSSPTPDMRGEKFYENFTESKNSVVVENDDKKLNVSFKNYSMTSENVKQFNIVKTPTFGQTLTKTNGNSYTVGKVKQNFTSDNNNFTESQPPTTTTTTERFSNKWRSTKKSINIKHGERENNDGITWDLNVTNSFKLTNKKQKQINKPEAVTSKDVRSVGKNYDTHLSFFILSSIGFIAMATLTFTSLYLSKTKRRDHENYQRQSQDIEVSSISSIGNELW